MKKKLLKNHLANNRFTKTGLSGSRLNKGPIRILAAFLAAALLLAGCGGGDGTQAESGSGRSADSAEVRSAGSANAAGPETASEKAEAGTSAGSKTSAGKESTKKASAGKDSDQKTSAGKESDQKTAAGTEDDSKAAGGKDAGQTTEDGTKEAAGAGSDAKETAKDKVIDTAYSFSCNVAGAGSGAYFPQESLHHDQRVADLTGCTIGALENADAVVLELTAEEYPAAIAACIESGAVLAIASGVPDEKDLETCMAYDGFAGGVFVNAYDMGVQMAEYAAADGNKTAVILSAAEGDPNYEKRVNGFRDKFENLGGQVLEVMYCADPSSAVTKADSLMSAQPDADCMYCAGNTYLTAACSVKRQKNTGMKLYGSEINPEYLDAVKDGTVSAVNGGQKVAGSLAMTLALNALDGHPILEKDGSVPLFDYLQLFVVTPKTAKAAQSMYADGGALITQNDYRELLYRYNPEVSIDTYYAFLSHYGERNKKRLQDAS